jgi:hypothetical protein
MCPNCRYGRKAKARLEQLQREEKARPEQDPQPESESKRTPRYITLEEAIALAMENGSTEVSPSGRATLEPPLPPVDTHIIPAFNRLLVDAAEPRKPELVIVEARSGVVRCGALLPQTKPPSLFVELPSRDLVLGEEQSEPKKDAAQSDLSDWLRETVRTLKGAGSVRVEVSRLGRLLSQGEAALRELGCEIIQDAGRSYVVYPARRR